MPLVRDVVRILMRHHTLTTVYGNPGSTELGFLHHWPADFRYIQALEEAAAVAMADGHAQITGHPVIVNLHAAAGLGNAMGSIVTAHHNRTPLILLAGQQTRRLLPHDPFLATLEPTQFGRTYLKWADQPARPQDVPAALARAIQIASHPPRGPVLLSVPNDDWEQPTTVLPLAPSAIAHCAPDPGAVAALAEKLVNCTAVAFVAGPAVDEDGAVRGLVELADKVGAHVWASPMSHRCSFPETHPRFAGHLPASPSPLAAALEQYEFVVVFGAPAFTYHVDSEPTASFPQMVVLHDDPHVLARAASGVARVHTTMKHAIAALTELLPAPAALTSRRAPLIDRRAPTAGSGDIMTAQTALHIVGRAIPDNAIVVEEIPSHRKDMHLHLPITTTPAGFLTTGSGVLGYGLPAAIGASVAAPDRPVIALIGDGSFMYRAQALHTAVDTQARLLVLIFDNHGYGALKDMSDSGGYHGVPGLDITGIQYADLARSLGCTALTVNDPQALDAAIADALSTTGPTVLHVPIDARDLTPS